MPKETNKNRSPVRTAVWIVAGIASLAAALQAQNVAKRLLVGDTKVDVVAKYQGDPLPKPEKALVYDFAVPPDVISVDTSPAARLHRRRGAAEAPTPPGGVARPAPAAPPPPPAGGVRQASLPPRGGP